MSNYIRQIQADLKQAGFYKGEIDGIAGKLTVSAVQDALAVGKATDKMNQAVMDENNSHPELGNKPISKAHKDSDFVFSNKSKKRLEGVKQSLVDVVKLALKRSSQDFGVTEGVRTKERQAELVAKGSSQTMHSKHITGDAVDLVAVVHGQVSWDLSHYYPIAEAMREAAIELGVKVKWGGAWQVLNDTTATTVELVENYSKARRSQGKKAFIDAPHFELA